MLKKEQRQSNYELLRIVSMLFIVLWHVIYQGDVLNHCENNGVRIIFLILAFITHVHVNSFILVTGYFQSKKKFKQSSVWSLINANLFYRIVFIILFSALGLISLNKLQLLQRSFFLMVGEYWFITDYLILYCLSPFLNKFIESVSKKDYQKLLLTLFVIMSIIPYFSGNKVFSNDGYSLYNFIFLYLIGAYFRKYPITENFIVRRCSKRLFQLLLIFCFAFCVSLNFSINQTASLLVGSNSIVTEISNNFIAMSFAYSNPIIIVQTISFFLFFGTLSFKSKIINGLSKLTIEVYLIHSNIFVNEFLYQWLNISNRTITSYRFILYAILVTLGIYCVCSLLGWFRQLLFKFIYNRKCITKIREKYYSFIRSIYVKEDLSKIVLED